MRSFIQSVSGFRPIGRVVHPKGLSMRTADALHRLWVRARAAFKEYEVDGRKKEVMPPVSQCFSLMLSEALPCVHG